VAREAIAEGEGVALEEVIEGEVVAVVQAAIVAAVEGQEEGEEEGIEVGLLYEVSQSWVSVFAILPYTPLN